MTIAIIGAGVAGMAAANELIRAGMEVEVFDKGRGAGGRLSTRRIATPLGEVAVDHGAQFFTTRDEGFEGEVEALIAKGDVAVWEGPFLNTGRSHVYVGAPKMNQFVKGLGATVPVQWGERVSRIEGQAPGLQLQFEESEGRGPYDHVVIAVPAEQAVDLLEEPAPVLASQVATIRTAPCWAAMIVFEAPVTTAFNGAELEDAPLRWIARNSSKPGRDGPETWVLHGSPEWSAAHIEDAGERVLEAFKNVLSDMLDPLPAIAATSTHRWRYAMTQEVLGEPFLIDRDTGISTCGDWHLGARVENAWVSGHRLGRELSRLLG